MRKTGTTTKNSPGISALLLALAMLCCSGHVATAETSSRHDTTSGHFVSTKSTQPYSLILSLEKNWQGGSAIPIPSVSLVNLGSETLAFSLDSFPGTGFAVEYQVEYKSNSFSSAKWMDLKPSVPPSATHHLTGLNPKVSTFSVVITLHPGEQYHDLYRIMGFPLLDDGVYRITAHATIPNAIEVTGPDNAATLVRKFDLKAVSNSVLLCRTANGFAPASPETSNQSASPLK